MQLGPQTQSPPSSCVPERREATSLGKMQITGHTQWDIFIRQAPRERKNTEIGHVRYEFWLITKINADSWEITS